jgi:pyruvate dehydrogenase E1 component beta subunit
MDLETVIASLKRTHRLVIVHEATGAFGWGAEVSASIQEKAFDELDAPIMRVTAEDTPIPYNLKLEKEMLPQVADIVNSVRRIVLSE